jgi:hypothetical protein
MRPPCPRSAAVSTHLLRHPDTEVGCTARRFRHNRHVPRYELEINDPNGGAPHQATFDSDDALGVDDTFEYQGGTVVVTSVEDADDASCEAKLVCDPQGGRPHYF